MSEQIILSSEPWVGGMQVRGWFGPVECDREVIGKSWEEAVYDLREDAAEKAREMGGNAVVGIEIECHPWCAPAKISLKGTVARLEPLFAGVTVYP